ncbi:MAG: hypothetical protein GY853_01260 [PVC group bacterium]|nr:hypothetical protein [PVC group bacterium]
MIDYDYDYSDVEYKEASERHERNNPTPSNTGIKICFMLRSMHEEDRKKVLRMIYEEFINTERR